MIDFNDYQERAITTKIYSDEIGVPYVVLGIIGEVGEFIEKMKEVEDEFEKDLLTKEIGDVYWYLAGFFSEIEKNMGDHIQFTKTLLAVDDAIEIIMIAPAQLAELTKKFLRDEYPNQMSAERFEKIVKLIQQLHDAMYFLCSEYQVNLEDVLEANIAKLQSRKDRGTLGGDGDTR